MKHYRALNLGSRRSTGRMRISPLNITLLTKPSESGWAFQPLSACRWDLKGNSMPFSGSLYIPPPKILSNSNESQEKEIWSGYHRSLRERDYRILPRRLNIGHQYMTWHACNRILAAITCDLLATWIIHLECMKELLYLILMFLRIFGA